MKKFIKFLLLAAIGSTAITSCSKDDPAQPDEPKAAPAVTWIDGDIDAVHEITDKMSVKIKVTAPAGIKTFMIDIDSPALTDEILGSLNLATTMDLISPATAAMGSALKELGFPTGTSIVNSTEQTFDISTLIPMIKAIYKESSNHNFQLTIKDNAGQTTVRTLKFHLTGPSSVAYNNDSDLWKNTATLTAKVQAEGDVKIEYRKKGSTEWQTAVSEKKADGTYTATIAPVWKTESKHATGVDQYSLDGKTGVFAGHTYEYRLTIAGTEADKNEFTTEAGQAITYGDMNTWSDYVGYILNPDPEDTNPYAKVWYPNGSQDNSFWGCGSNHFTQTLCTSQDIEGGGTNKAAHLQGINFAVYAAGNLFTGVFDFSLSTFSGAACFGQPYEYTARPTGLKVRVKATINKFTHISSIKENELTTEDIDPARIFVCITDWNDRHRVTSGLPVLSDPSLINAYDPCNDADPAEGKVIAYGSKMFTESIGEWTELTIPIVYKDKTAKPATDKYSLVISCASCAYGDYLCGNPDNALDIDYFEWVY